MRIFKLYFNKLILHNIVLYLKLNIFQSVLIFVYKTTVLKIIILFDDAQLLILSMLKLK